MDMSQYEVGVQFQTHNILDYLVNQRIAYRQGNAYSYAAPHAAYRCRGNDRWCAIAVFTGEEWKNFCEVIGKPSWTTDPKFATLPARKENEDELNKIVEEWTVNYLAEEIMIMMQKAGVSAGLVETSEDMLDHDPQLRHSQFALELEHPEVGKYKVHRPPFLTPKAPYEMRRTPLLGEHNEYVCREVLGMSDDEIAELVVEGVLE
jgi:benzylsuccinate CoA-transferase BbsF subunit